MSLLYNRTMSDGREWRWTREPAAWTPGGPNALAWTCAPDSDFWRETHSGAIKHDGHGYVTGVEGDFAVQGSFAAQLGARYDQLGLIAIADERRWVKTGVELDGELLIGAVHTKGHSDWSCGPGSLPVDLRMERRDGTVEISCRPPGDGAWRMIRQLYLEWPLAVGPYSCAPTGTGFEAKVTGLTLELL
jgi:regulation of enolase protein 1 (concanavalin A-like superfamily)